jgi:hypothetical protein
MKRTSADPGRLRIGRVYYGQKKPKKSHSWSGSKGSSFQVDSGQTPLLENRFGEEDPQQKRCNLLISLRLVLSIMDRPVKAGKSTLAMPVIDFATARRFSMKRTRTSRGGYCTGMVRHMPDIYPSN